MSTFKNNISAQRMALLAKKQEVIFHIDDLANLWEITDRNTLRVTLKRYTDNKLLYRIYRGFYSIHHLSELDPLILGIKALHQFCYISTETVLWREGYISQAPSTYTLVSTLSKQFRIGPHRFLSRKLHDRYLYQPVGVNTESGVKQATPERAIADILYFNPKFHFDRPIPWKHIKKIQNEIGYPRPSRSEAKQLVRPKGAPLTPQRYDSPKKN